MSRNGKKQRGRRSRKPQPKAQTAESAKMAAQILAKTKTITAQDAVQRAAAVSMVRQSATHALAVLGQDAANPVSISIYLMGIGVSDLLARGASRQKLRDLLEATMSTMAAQVKAVDDAVVAVVEGRPEE